MIQLIRAILLEASFQQHILDERAAGWSAMPDRETWKRSWWLWPAGVR